MTKAEQNQIIKDAWIKALQKEDDIPTNIGDVYRNWLLSKIQEAHVQLNPPPPGNEEEAQDDNKEKEAS